MEISHSGPQENLQIDSVLCATIQIWSKLEIRPIYSFDHQFLGFWKVMNIIASGCSPCLLVPPGLDSEKQTLWERRTHKPE